jgi:homoaconitase
MSEERRPRSRFDSDDTERPARSRFDTDRRSRSPSRRQSESLRARSPVAREASDSPSAASLTKNKAAAAAAAAAARINAQIQAKKGIQHVDVPPIRSVSDTFAPLGLGPADNAPRSLLLQSSSRRLLAPARLSRATSTSRMETSSRTLKSMICATATH